jgi:pilus assembly protein CpaE
MPEKILFVDDEEQIRKLVGTFLDRHGYSVRTACNGAEALRAISEDPPDLVITDLSMPDVDGLALTRQLRASHLTSRLPIIMLSAHKETGDVLAGYGAGADEYVPKPVELSVLGAKVAVVLGRTRAVATAAPTQRGIVSLFMHGKGGVGTTTLAVNTAISIAEVSRSSVALLDLNLGFGNAEMLLGLQPSRRLDQLALFDFRQMEPTAFVEFLTPHPSGVSFLAGPATPEVAESITPAMVEFALERLRGEVAHVVVDLPVSFSDVTLSALDAADLVCVVTSPEIAALKATRDCLRITERLRVVSPERTLVALNRTSAKGLPNDKAAELLHHRLDATIPYDSQFDESADEGRPFVTARRLRPGRRAIMELAERIAACKVHKQDERRVWAT